jgi:tape measure domain-containing protein
MASNAGSVYVDLGLNAAKFQQGLQGAGKELSKFGNAATSVGRSLSGAFTGLAAGLAATVSTAAIAAAAGQYVKLQNALRVTGLQGEALEKTFGTLFQIAQRQGTAIEPLVGLYSKLSLSQKELGVSGEQLQTFTEGIATALKVGGTSAEQAGGALLQLSQALGGSIVRAEEFNSVLEGAPTILQTVAKGLTEAGGSVAKLRTLVIDGELSSKAFFNAFLAGMPQLAEQSKLAADTTDQGFARVRNAFVLLIGKLDETLGASKNASEGLTGVGNAIAAIPAYIDAAAAGFDKLNRWMTEAGNNPFWKKLGQLMGVDYSPEGIAANLGFTPAGQMGGIGSDRGASVPYSSGGIGSDRAAGGVGTTTTTVSLKDYAVTADAATKAVKDTTAATRDLNTELDTSNALLDDMQQTASSALSGFINDLRQGVPAGEALQGVVDQLLQKLIDMASNQLIASLFSSLAGLSIGGGGFNGTGKTPGGLLGRAATGGLITGPGSGTSDSIPTMLSNGEYVVKASQAGKHRALLDAINNGTITRMASGGPVGRSSGGGGSGSGRPQQPIINISNNSREDVQASTRDDGTTEIIIGTMQKANASGRMNSSMRGTFGVGNNRIRRGSA